METLPKDIIYTIGENLSVRDLESLVCTCRSYHFLPYTINIRRTQLMILQYLNKKFGTWSTLDSLINISISKLKS